MSATLTQACDRAIAVAEAAAAPVAHPRLVLTATVLASSLAFIDGAVLNVALPAIAQSFGAATAEVQWVINAFLLPLSALLLIGGALGDLYGRRRMLIIGIAIFTIASLLCAFAPSLDLFLAGRALQGIGAAMLMPNSLAILGNAFAGEHRGRAVGIWAAAGAISGAAAPLLGGWMVDTAGWPAIFLLNLPIALGALLIAIRHVPESREPGRPNPDWGGALLGTAALGALTWGLTARSSGQESGAGAYGAMAAGALFLLLFLLAERRRGATAMMPLSMFGSSSFVGLTLLTFLLYGAFGGLLVLLPYVLIEGAGYSAVEAGSAILPLPIAIGLASPITGRLAERMGPRLPLTLGPLLVAGGFLLALRIDADASYWTTVFPALLLLSCGMATAVAPLTTAVLASVGPDHTGTASGLNSAVARTGGLIATALLGAVLARQGAELIEAFHGAVIAGALLAAMAAVSAFALLRPKETNGRVSR